MIEYRLSPEDDELDDFDEGAELSLDDDMGDYGPRRGQIIGKETGAGRVPQ